MFDHFRAKRPQVMSPIQQISETANAAGLSCARIAGASLHQFLRHGPEQHFQIRMADRFAAEGDGLIKQAQPSRILPSLARARAMKLRSSMVTVLRCYVTKAFDDFVLAIRRKL